MKDFIFADFQSTIADLLVRHKSVLDILTKFQDSNARVNRAVVKAVTNCGCIHIDGKKQEYPEDVSLNDMKNYTDNHLRGELCDNCRDAIEKELGNHLFYLASLANTFDMSLWDILLKEEKSLSALGVYHLK